MYESYFDILTLPQTASTQSFLTKEDAESDFSEYKVIYTTNQTSGRGQGTHVWESEAGKNISFSLLLTPECIAPSDQYLITKFVSLAIVDCLEKYIKKDIKIKWPNDIYIGLNKICGILIQNKIYGNLLQKSYIGIGLNVNQEKFSFAPNPTSLILETSTTFPLDKILNDILDNIYIRYNMVKNGKKEEIDRLYADKLLFKDEYREYLFMNKKVTAKIVSVNTFGHLILEYKNGSKECCDMTQLQFIIPQRNNKENISEKNLLL